MSPNEFDPRTLIAESRIGILATIKSNGVPQLSLVTAVYDSEADIIYVSMTDGRAKTANLRRATRGGDRVHQPRRIHLGDRGRRSISHRARRRSRRFGGRRPSSTITDEGPANTRTGRSTARSWSTTGAC